MTDTMTDPSPPPPPHAPPPLGPRRLHRSTSDRMLAGVGGGLGRYLGVDPTLVRIGLVLLSFAGGVGLIAYGAAWLLVPEDGEVAPERRPAWQLAPICGAAFVVVGLLDAWDGGAAVPLALLLVGAVLVWGGREERAADAPTAAPAAGSGVVVEQRGPGRWSWAPPEAPTAAPAGPPPPLVDRVPRQVGRAFAVACGGMLLALGAISGAVAASDDIATTTFLGISLAGFGVLMALGSFWGWSRPLAFGALTLVLALATASIIDVPLRGGVGDHVIRPRTASEVPVEERLAVGSLDIDLTLLDPSTFTDGRAIEASVGMGELVVTVPEGVAVELRAEAGAGLVEVLGEERDGVSVEVDRTIEGTTGRVELDLAVGVGHVEVRRG